MNTAIKIFTDKVNNENFELALDEFKDFMIPNEKNAFNEEYLDENTKKIYDMFIELKNKI